MRRLLSLIAVLVVLLGMAALSVRPAANAQDFPEARRMQESTFEHATGEVLAGSLAPVSLPPSAGIALLRLHIAPRGRIVTPADEPTVVLLYVERGTVTVRTTVPAMVTRGAALATPGAQAQDAFPAETAFTMSAGDASLSPPMAGGELRNEGSEEVSILASLIDPDMGGAATPEAGTPTL